MFENKKNTTKFKISKEKHKEIFPNIKLSWKVKVTYKRSDKGLVVYRNPSLAVKALWFLQLTTSIVSHSFFFKENSKEFFSVQKLIDFTDEI